MHPYHSFSYCMLRDIETIRAAQGEKMVELEKFNPSP
jgi:hypothetical protein